jgi:ribosomal protein L34E
MYIIKAEEYMSREKLVKRSRRIRTARFPGGKQRAGKAKLLPNLAVCLGNPQNAGFLDNARISAGHDFC